MICLQIYCSSLLQSNLPLISPSIIFTSDIAVFLSFFLFIEVLFCIYFQIFNTSNAFIPSALILCLHNHICVHFWSVLWFIFSLFLNVPNISPLCHIKLDGKDYNFTYCGVVQCIEKYIYSWVFPWSTVNLVGNTLILLDLLLRFVKFSSVAQSYSTLRPHESEHARPPCPSPTPGVYSNSCP